MPLIEPPDAAYLDVGDDPCFGTTRWSLILQARDSASPDAGEALNALCRIYWYPLYAFARRKGCSKEDAEDLTQGFWMSLLARRSIDGVDPKEGRFRSFLRASFLNFKADHWKWIKAEKRGGKIEFVPFDLESCEARYCSEPQVAEEADKAYTRTWALSLLDQARSRHQEEFAQIGKSMHYEWLRAFLPNGGGGNYAELAARLGTTETAARVAVCRFRQRYARLVREEVASTLANPEDINDELQYLLQAVET